MKTLKLLMITAILLLAAIPVKSQFLVDSLRAGDSLSSSPEGGMKVKYCYAHLWNTSASLTDSVKFYILSPKYSKGGRILRDTTFVDFIKKSSPGDSVQSVLVLQPTSGSEDDYSEATIMINIPYPNQSMARLCNEVYSTSRKTQIRWIVPIGSY